MKEICIYLSEVIPDFNTCTFQYHAQNDSAFLKITRFFRYLNLESSVSSKPIETLLKGKLVLSNTKNQSKTSLTVGLTIDNKRYSDSDVAIKIKMFKAFLILDAMRQHKVFNEKEPYTTNNALKDIIQIVSNTDHINEEIYQQLLLKYPLKMSHNNSPNPTADAQIAVPRHANDVASILKSMTLRLDLGAFLVSDLNSFVDAALLHIIKHPLFLGFQKSHLPLTTITFTRNMNENFTKTYLLNDKSITELTFDSFDLLNDIARFHYVGKMIDAFLNSLRRTGPAHNYYNDKCLLDEVDSIQKYYSFLAQPVNTATKQACIAYTDYGLIPNQINLDIDNNVAAQNESPRYPAPTHTIAPADHPTLNETTEYQASEKEPETLNNYDATDGLALLDAICELPNEFLQHITFFSPAPNQKRPAQDEPEENLAKKVYYNKFQ